MSGGAIRYVVTAATTVAAGTAATLTPGELGTGAPAGPGNAAVTGGPLFATTFLKGTPLLLDTAGSLYVALNGLGRCAPTCRGRTTCPTARPATEREAKSMSKRIVLTSLDIAWDGGVQHIPAGTILDVPPASAMEAAYGPQNLADLDPGAAEAAAAGAGVSN